VPLEKEKAMSRYVLLVVLCFFVSLPRFAHAFADQPTAPAQTTSERHSDNGTCARSAHPGDALTSSTRLTESRKARELYEKAKRAWARGLEAEAQNKLGKALKVDPTFPEALTLYGIIQAGHQRWKSAEASLKAAIQSDSRYAPAYVVLAGVYNSEERFNDAQEATTQALSAGANTWHVRYEIARAFIGKGQYESALAAIDATPPPSRDTGWMPLVKALALAGLRRYQEAATELRLYLFTQSSGDGSQYARDLLKQIDSLIPDNGAKQMSVSLCSTR
jgi:tetratricopeptide (TPR) repeat protein